MSEKNLTDEKVDSEDEDEDDDDYCPTKNKNEQSEQSDASDDESEHGEPSVNNQNEPVDDDKQTDTSVKPYDESKTDELWKSFTSSAKPSSTTTTTAKTTEIEKPKTTTTKVFDYAGEKVPVAVPSNPSLKRPAAAVSTSSSSSVLDRLGIGKKPKLSTLEKSRLDWQTHKQVESLTEDLESHRRGKDSYVEKKAFLERAEVRQHDHYLTNVKKK